jgi:Cytochrome P450
MLSPIGSMDTVSAFGSLHHSRLEAILQTIAVATHFILAMTLYPHVLAKAHEEIDTVIGNHRLPTFADRPSLPYIECIMSECLRWAVPVPLSESQLFPVVLPFSRLPPDIPHLLMRDDIYRGMLIPKGSLVRLSDVCFPNIYKSMHLLGLCKHLVRSLAFADLR